MKTCELFIIGGGPAGMAAAIEAHRLGIKDIIIAEREKSLGGILLQCIHNGFGIEEYKKELTGPEFAQRLIDEVEELNISFMLSTTVTSISEDRVVSFMSRAGFAQLKAGAVIFATGSRERPRGAISIPGTRPAGIWTAGTAQKYLNMDGYMVGKRVFILGSGDIGLIMARRMTLEGAKVLGVAEIMPYSNGLNRNIVQCLNDFDIPLYLSHTVAKISGNSRIEAIELAEVDEKRNIIEASRREIKLDALLLSVGLIPDVELLGSIGTELSPESRGPIVTNTFESSSEGIFACGNCLHIHDIVDFVVAEARSCAAGAVKYLKAEVGASVALAKAAAGEGLSYIVPQRIDSKNLAHKQRFYFRVQRVMRRAKIVLSVNGEVLKEYKKIDMLPAEMGFVDVERELLENAKSIEFWAEEF